MRLPGGRLHCCCTQMTKQGNQALDWCYYTKYYFAGYYVGIDSSS